uniref:General transcription factor IIH subunit 3 n=1 Tax=Arcella intermedia TaxID=1963864 RepID=A0A6B2LEQ5_9EUKA
MLVLVLDLSGSRWKGDHKGLDLSTLLQNLALFWRSYFLLDARNKLALIAYDQELVSFLVSSEDVTKQQTFEEVVQVFNTNLTKFLSHHKKFDVPLEQPTRLATALSMALSYSNKANLKLQELESRFLVLSVSPEPSVHSISLMNIVFTAKKMNIPIDCCILSCPSLFYPQASHITQGIHLDLSPTPALLLPSLLSTFLCDPYSRQHLPLPKLSSVSLGSSCFCHQRPLTLGFVCTYCLSSTSPAFPPNHI